MCLWFRCSVFSSSLEVRSQNCARADYVGPVRFLRARFVFHDRVVGAAMSAVSVIIPALNEEEPIADVVRECLATKIPREVIVVDNGSDDRTAERVREAGAEVVSEPTRGYGRACAAGVH